MELSPLYLERIQDATDRGIEQGIERGIERGIEQGIKREAVALVMRQLRRRLGAIAPEVEEQIRGLSVDRLENLAEALLDFENEANLIAWLERTNN